MMNMATRKRMERKNERFYSFIRTFELFFGNSNSRNPKSPAYLIQFSSVFFPVFCILQFSTFVAASCWCVLLGRFAYVQLDSGLNDVLFLVWYTWRKLKIWFIAFACAQWLNTHNPHKLTHEKIVFRILNWEFEVHFEVPSESCSILWQN